MHTFFQKLKTALHQKVSIATMVYFRLLFGGIMMWEVYRYFSKGWIKKYYIEPEFIFRFFEWDILTPLSGNGMYYIWGFVGLMAFFVFIGFMYRISIILLTISFAYIFLLEKAHYLNHLYFACMLGIAMSFCSPHRFFSVDAKIFPKIKTTETYQWQPWLICFLMTIVYFWGGIAKINPDWLVGNPLYFWVRKVGWPFNIYEVIVFMAWVGMLYDLLIGFILFHPKTRWLGVIACSCFHMTNAYMFHIGIFPWLSLGLTFMFFKPSWPFDLYQKLSKKSISEIPMQEYSVQQKNLINIFLAFVFLYNNFMPIRHHFMFDKVFWTEEGHRYSWRMKLRSKRAKTPLFKIVDNQTGKEWKTKGKKYLTKRQRARMKARPDMVIDFGKYLASQYRQKSSGDLSVYVKNYVSLNYRPYYPLIKEDYDILKVKNCLMCEAKHLTRFFEERTFKKSYELMKKLRESKK